MRKVSCPECDEVVKVPDESKTVRCPACHTRIVEGGPKNDENDEEDEPRPKKRRKKAPGQKRVRGLIPLLFLAPAGFAIAGAAPFSSAGTQLAIWFGFGYWILGLVCVRAMYQEPDDGASAEAFGVWVMFHAIGASFRYPRLLAAWTLVLWLGIALICEGVLAAVVLKTLQQKPADPGPNAGGEQQPGAGPNPPPARPAPTPPRARTRPSPRTRRSPTRWPASTSRTTSHARAPRPTSGA
ncbi:zinc-ribbon domain-containing protein [Frigoriglobus tundricola]|uniref:Uncharacterized protein n=1 Tax=Frigoriglobus tundricola TaxID=2774151 RepID=A0A6M5YUN9_9BACT|nr:zinc-ribbon domain-containing protein [Frigoriglobus tundricola]QJW97144.1 hypothetical protein FTUN_4709 [Frigoriglobus tundricola]